MKNIKFKNLPEDKLATSHTSSLPVQVMGPLSQLRSLSEDDISVEVDLSGKEEFIGRTQMPAKIIFNSYSNKCWAYGSYNINIGITKK